MSACAQLIIAFLLILLQLAIIIALFIMEPPEVNTRVLLLNWPFWPFCLYLSCPASLCALIPHIKIWNFLLLSLFSVSKLSEGDASKPSRCLGERATMLTFLNMLFRICYFLCFTAKQMKMSCLHFKSDHPSVLSCFSQTGMGGGAILSGYTLDEPRAH